jgi:diguanylate cyclase (GGDEF)-like protein
LISSSRARRAGELAARYGGEEFAVLLPHIDIAEAAKLAELICATVRECEIPHQHSEVSPYVTVSIGVASISEFPDSAAVLSREGIVPVAFAPGATVLVEAADHALYEAKAAGRNRVVVAGPNDAAALVAVELSGV